MSRWFLPRYKIIWNIFYVLSHLLYVGFPHLTQLFTCLFIKFLVPFHHSSPHRLVALTGFPGRGILRWVPENNCLFQPESELHKISSSSCTALLEILSLSSLQKKWNFCSSPSKGSGSSSPVHWRGLASVLRRPFLIVERGLVLLRWVMSQLWYRKGHFWARRKVEWTQMFHRLGGFSRSRNTCITWKRQHGAGSRGRSPTGQHRLMISCFLPGQCTE